MGEFTNNLISSIFPQPPGPLRSKENTPGLARTTNPNARATSKGKTAKSKKRRMREAQQQQAGFANQQQMQSDQFKFLKDNIFDRTGATRRTIGGQIEQPGPQGLDFFKNSGPDRPEVAARKAALDAASLSQPDAWTNAQSAVNRQKQVQGWADPNTPPPQAPSNFNQDQYMKTPGKFMDVFSNGDGTVTRSRANPYGSASAVYSPPVQGPPKPSAPAGPVQQLFQPQAPVNTNNVAQGGFTGPPNLGDASMGPVNTPVNRTVAEWNSLFGQPQEQPLPALPQNSYEQAVAGTIVNPPEPTWYSDPNSDMSFMNDFYGPTTGFESSVSLPQTPTSMQWLQKMDPTGLTRMNNSGSVGSAMNLFQKMDPTGLSRVSNLPQNTPPTSSDLSGSLKWIAEMLNTRVAR